MFSCQFCKIFKNTYFYKHLWWLLLYKPLIHKWYRPISQEVKAMKFGQLIEFFFFFLIFLSGFSFTNIHDLRDSRRKGEAIYLTPLYHFHALHRHLDISRAITAKSSPQRIASSRTRTGNLWFPSASPWPLSYAPSWEVFFLKNYTQNALRNYSQVI